MAYVNVIEWRAEQVAEWLQGLDDVIQPYAHFFINNNVTGQGLLNLTVDDLYKLHVEKIGHQEIILEALEMLKNLHYNLDTENLQYVCLRLSCRARSLSNEIRLYGPPESEVKQTVTTQTMSAVADVVDSFWAVLSWLERPPFDKQEHYQHFKWALIKISIVLVTSAQRDRFAENPVNVIRECCDKLADLSETVIREMYDSLILQPAYLDIATIKRKADEKDFGVVFGPQICGGAHLVREIRIGSAAARTGGRIEPGDEVVQVNYQTVVGWQIKKMLRLMEENSQEVILTLKKRPRHSQLFGQIYMKPFRIPARQTNPPNYFNNLPSPRPELLVAPNISTLSAKNTRPSKLSQQSASLDQPPPVHSSSPALEKASPPFRNESEPSSSSVLSPSEFASTSDDFADLSSGEEHFDDSSSDDESAFLPTSTSTGQYRANSPTHSIRSVLSRPRSAPQRRATISGTSPSHFKDYINISEIWEQFNKDKDRDSSSTTSTLHSKDSGLSTMSSLQRDQSNISSDDLELKPKNVRLEKPPRPKTMAPRHKFTEPKEHPFYMNLPESSKAALMAASKAAVSATAKAKKSGVEGHDSERRSSQQINSPPKSKQNNQPPPGNNFVLRDVPVKKRPIPQPRRTVNQGSASTTGQKSGSSLSTNTSGHESSFSEFSSPSTPKESLARSLRNLLPEAVTKSTQPVMPVPTANFKSFKKVVQSVPFAGGQEPPVPPKLTEKSASRQNLAEYINTSPPVIPDRSSKPPLVTPTKPLAAKLPAPDDLPVPKVAPPPRPVKPAKSSAELTARESKPTGARIKQSRPPVPVRSGSEERHKPVMDSSVKSVSRSSLREGKTANRIPVTPGMTSPYYVSEISVEKVMLQDKSPAAKLRSAQSYQPVPTPQHDEASKKPLKYAFDMELADREQHDSKLDEDDYTYLSDLSSVDLDYQSAQPTSRASDKKQTEIPRQRYFN